MAEYKLGLIDRFPPLTTISELPPDKHRMFIGAFGFEDRSLGWCSLMKEKGINVLSAAYLFKYVHHKGPNRIKELRDALAKIGSQSLQVIKYDSACPQALEDTLPEILKIEEFDEVIIDISAMTKLLILLVLCQVRRFTGTIRIVYSEANEYCPSEEEYDPVKGEMATTAKFPSRGAEQIIRLRCLSSIRMQGQPITLVAFTSFNEKLVSHMLGFISPHRLILINGRPPHKEYQWRELATSDIHKRLYKEYELDNPVNKQNTLKRVSSTLDYRDAIYRLDEIYQEYGFFERIICAATGSKMQTVGLFFAKILHPDIQVEYPTPDSYYFKDMTHGVREVHEVAIPNFASFTANLADIGLLNEV